MKSRLIAALLRVCAEKEHESFVIEDLIKAADVSRGTFYKYYNSIDELMSEVVTLLTDQITRENILIAQDVQEPIVRTAIGLRHIFLRALKDNYWGHFASRITVTGNDQFIKKFARQEYIRGRESGDYNFGNIDAAVDVTFGSIASVLRAISRGTVVEEYVSEASIQILLSLGASRSLAEYAIECAKEKISLMSMDREKYWQMATIAKN